MPEMCDILSSIKYVYRTSKFFGVLPYTIETINGQTKATPSHCCFLFSVLTSLVIFAHGLTFPFYVFGSEVPCFFCQAPQYLTPNTTQQIIVTSFMFQKIALKIINRMIVSVMSFCALFFALFFSARIPAFIEKLNDADYFFRALLKHSEKSVACCISGWIVCGLLVGSSPAISYYMYTDISGPDTTVTSVVWVVVLMWDNMNSATSECLFINFAYLIKVRFEIINNYLIDFQAPSDMEFKNGRKVAVHPRPEVLQPPNVRLLSLEMCRWCHRCLCDLAVDLNRMYQAVFLSTLGGCFLKVLFVVFAMVVGSTRRHSSGMYEEIIKRIFWVVFYAARFFALILFACKTVQEGEHTKTLVAEISSSCEPEEIKKELLLFNNQITNRKIEFSACSLFSLNTGLITSAVGLGTTYLVILVQFHAPA